MTITKPKTDKNLLAELNLKARQVRREMLRLHKLSPETRVASCLSDVEIFVALYYGRLLRFDPKSPRAPGRDRFIISKGHGGISLYPILADLGFFGRTELERIGKPGGILCGIPDDVPGFETVNGSLGHGLGVGCGMALALKRTNSRASVVVLMGDGELYEGAVWEALMFAGHHRLDNLTLIIDRNKKCMLGPTCEVVDLAPLPDKLRSFRWEVRSGNGHDIALLLGRLGPLLAKRGGKPKVFIAETIKGKGVPSFEKDPMCHIRSLTPEQVDRMNGEDGCPPLFH